MAKSKKRRTPPDRPASPSPAEVSFGRSAAGLTAVGAGDIICVSGRAWTNYERADPKVKGVRMNGALWRYFCMVTNQFELL